MTLKIGINGWGCIADVVIESTGIFLDKAGGEKHLAAGAKKSFSPPPAKTTPPCLSMA